MWAMRVECLGGSQESHLYKQGGSEVTGIASALVCSVVTCLTSQYGTSLQDYPTGQGIPATEHALVGRRFGEEI